MFLCFSFLLLRSHCVQLETETLQKSIAYAKQHALNTHPEFFSNFLRDKGGFPPTALA